MVLRMDAFAGELAALLEDLGIRERTLVAFASDNGYSMCGYFARGNRSAGWPDDPFFRNKGPFRGGKFSLLEGGIRVPFFISWPGTVKPAVSSDLFPTFALLAASHAAPANDGQSLLPILSGNSGDFPANRALYWENGREQAVRMGPWKAYRRDAEDEMQLFLIEEDVGSERNVGRSYPGVAAEMAEIMRREHVDHPWYWNPTETREDFERKQELAAKLGQLQVSRAGNQVP